MKTLCLFTGLVLLTVATTYAQTDTFSVGGTRIVVPEPQGFFRVNEDMTTLKNFLASYDDPTNDTLAFYILESDVPAAMGGEMITMDRYFSLKVNKKLRDSKITNESFTEIRKVIKDQNDDIIKNLEPTIRENLSNAAEKITEEFDIELNLELNQMVPLTPHYEEENVISYSMFVNQGVATEEEKMEAHIFPITLTLLNVSDRLLYLYSYGQQEDLEWTRTASTEWSKIISASNTQPSTDSTGILDLDWNKLFVNSLSDVVTFVLTFLILYALFRWMRRAHHKS